MNDYFFSCMGSCFHLSFNTTKPTGDYIELVISGGLVVSALTNSGSNIPDVLLKDIADKLKEDKTMTSYSGTVYVKVS